MLPSWWSCCTVVEARQRVPDAGRRALWGTCGQNICCRCSRAGCRSRRSSASSRGRGAGARSGRSTGSRPSGRRPWRRTAPSSVGLAAHRVAVLRAARRPAGDQREVRRQAPGVVRLEHVVLEHEVARVVPVVRDLVPVVVAHHVGLPTASASSRGCRCRDRRGSGPCAPARWKPSILPAVDVADRVDGVVRAAGVAVGRVVVRLDADVRLRVGIADGRHAVLASGSRRRRDTCRSRSRTSGSPA